MTSRSLWRLPFLLLLLFRLALPASAAASDLYVSSSGGANVQRFDGTTGASVSSFPAGTNPAGVAFGPDSALYVVAYGNNDILRYDPVAGTTNVFVAAGAGGLSGPLGVAFGPDGNLYVTSGGNSVLRFSGTTGAFLNTFVSSGSGGLSGAFDLIFGPDNNLYVTSGSSVLRFSGTTGAFLNTFVSTGSGGLSNADSLAFGPDGDLYVVSNGSSGSASGVLRYDGTTGAFVNEFVTYGANGLVYPFGLAFGPDGNLYVTSQANPNGGTNYSVLRFNGTTGAYLGVFASVPSLPNYLIFGPNAATQPPKELITNGGFEAGSLSGWNVSTEANSNGSFYPETATSALPYGAPPTAGPKSGNDYAVSAEGGSTAAALSQTFTVPGPAQKVILSFDMFVNDYNTNAPGAVVGAQGLDYTGVANQQARVDLLTPTASPLSTASADVLKNFYDGVDSHAVSNPHGYTHYTFDITSLVGQGGTYALRFAEVNNQSGLLQGVDNVSVQYVAGTPPPPGQELITNGGFETGDLSGWSTGSETGGSGGPYEASSTTTPASDPFPTVGPATGADYANSTEKGPSASYLNQTFTVPGPAQKVILSFDMFVNDYNTNAPGAVVGAQGLDYTGVANQQARVDLLTPTASPLSTASADVLKNFYDGVDSHAVSNPHGYTHYTFDITSLVSSGGSYTLRFAQAHNQQVLIQGLDNVSVQYTPAQTAPAPLTLSVSPAAVLPGGPSTLTLTLSSPAQPGPDPSGLGDGQYGAEVRLDNSAPAAVRIDSGVLHGTDGNTYILVPTGKTTATVQLFGQNVPATTAATFTGTYNGGGSKTVLTVNPVQVASLTLNPTTVYNGQTATETITLNSPAVPMPDPSNPGQTANGAVILLGSDSAAVTFQAASTSSGTVFQASNGKFYAFIGQGQTTSSFTVLTSSVASKTTANISATLNSASQSAALTITPTLVSSITLNPTSVYNGGPTGATITLNGPAVPGPDPSNPGQTANGAVILLGSDSAAATFQAASTSSGTVFQASNGKFYAFIPQGGTTASFTVLTSFVPASTTANISATLNGVSQSAALTITPTLVASVVLNPTSVYNGQPATETITLNGPAVPMPDPSNPGQTANGAVILLGSDSAAVTFQAASTSSGTVFQASNGKFYAFIGQGQTTASFTVLTSYAASKTTANLSATLNGASQSAALTITPTQVSSLFVNPIYVYNGQTTTATITLNNPAVPMPDPTHPGQTANGAIVALTSNNAAVFFVNGSASNGGSVFQANGNSYLFIPQGQTTVAFPVGTSYVPTLTDTLITATLGSTSQSTRVSVVPTQVQSLALAPTSVTAGTASTATITLNGPAVPMPDPSNPGQTANGAVILLGSDSAAATFQAASTSSGTVFQASNGKFYAFIPQGGTTASFPVLTGSVASRTTANISATLNSASQSAPLTITPALTPTTLTVANVTGAPSQKVSLSASLTGGGGGVGAKTVTFSVDGTVVGTAATNAGGVATLPYTVNAALAAGSHTISASFAGDGTYAASTGTGTLTVTVPKVATAVAVTNRSGTAGQSVTLYAGVRRTDTGKYVAGETVTFSVDGTVVGTATTASSGFAALSYLIPAGTSGGSHTISASFGGDGTYGASTGTGTLTVAVPKVATAVAVTNRSGHAGQSVTLYAGVRRTDTGKYVAGETITFSVDGKAVGTAVTAASGFAPLSYLIPAGTGAGSHTISASFAGDSAYSASTGTGTLTVN